MLRSAFNYLLDPFTSFLGGNFYYLFHRNCTEPRITDESCQSIAIHVIVISIAAAWQPQSIQNFPSPKTQQSFLVNCVQDQFVRTQIQPENPNVEVILAVLQLFLKLELTVPVPIFNYLHILSFYHNVKIFLKSKRLFYEHCITSTNKRLIHMVTEEFVVLWV